jgi:hypothetical protein
MFACDWSHTVGYENVFYILVVTSRSLRLGRDSFRDWRPVHDSPFTGNKGYFCQNALRQPYKWQVRIWDLRTVKQQFRYSLCTVYWLNTIPNACDLEAWHAVAYATDYNGPFCVAWWEMPASALRVL